MTACVNCGVTDPGTYGWCRGRCGACYMYRYRTGRERPPVVGRVFRGQAVRATCVTCGRPRYTPGYRSGRECGACRTYRWRRGVARPVALEQRRGA